MTNGGYSVAEVCGLLIAAPSLVEHGLYGMAWGLNSCGSWPLEHRLSSCGVRDLVAQPHVESSWTRDQTHGPCIGR